MTSMLFSGNDRSGDVELVSDALTAPTVKTAKRNMATSKILLCLMITTPYILIYIKRVIYILNEKWVKKVY